jgi:restriction system protein
MSEDMPRSRSINPAGPIVTVPIYGETTRAHARSRIVMPPPAALEQAPGVLLSAIITPGENTPEGLIVEAVAAPWFSIVNLLERDPNAVYQFDWRQWEQIIAGAYTEAYPGAEVILTPRSGDKGRAVIATVTLPGIGRVRYFDQVKRYSADHRVSADEVRALVGVLYVESNVSKAIITTTSTFAPGVETDENLKRLMPTRLELKPREVLLPWLAEIAAKRKGGK